MSAAEACRSCNGPLMVIDRNIGDGLCSLCYTRHAHWARQVFPGSWTPRLHHGKAHPVQLDRWLELGCPA